jgi:hypothetical protein
VADYAEEPLTTPDPAVSPGVVRSVGLTRVAWLVLFAVPSAVLVTAALLTPNPIGHGTHMQLGLPACGFMVYTGIPCPGCGLTTCFAFMMRGDIVAAAAANPSGVLLFLLTLATVPVAAVGFVRAHSVLDTLDRLHAEKWALLLAVTSLVVWAVRVGRILL